MPINTTGSTASTAFFNKEYYDKVLLITAKTKLVHAAFGQKRPIPRNSGKRVEFRRYELFDVDADVLTLDEGVTPDGQSLNQTHVEAECKSYGAYVELSDVLEMTALDPVVDDSAMLLGEQLGTVAEWVTRDAMAATTNKQYAGGKTSRIALTASDKLTVNEVRKAVRTLKKNKARMFTKNVAVEGGANAGRKPHFICICGPDATYDLQSDQLWQDVSKYSNSEQIYAGELGRLFGVVFVESTEAKIYKQSVLNAVSAATTTSQSFVLKNTPSAAGVAYLSTPGNKIKVGSDEYTIASYAPGTKTVTFTEAAASLSKDAIVYSEDAGALDANKAGIPVASTLIFGEDAYGVIDISGSSAMQTIIKPAGTAGFDPLNQRSTVGAKVAMYTAKVLNNLWIVEIQSAYSL